MPATSTSTTEVESLRQQLASARADMQAMRRERDSLAKELQRLLDASAVREEERAAPAAPRVQARRVSAVNALPPRGPSEPALPIASEQLWPYVVAGMCVFAVVVLALLF